MAESLLHEVDRRSAVETVRGMGVPEPMSRYVFRHPRACRGHLHDAMDSRHVEVPSFPRPEHGIIATGLGSDGLQRFPSVG